MKITLPTCKALLKLKGSLTKMLTYSAAWHFSFVSKNKEVFTLNFY